MRSVFLGSRVARVESNPAHLAITAAVFRKLGDEGAPTLLPSDHSLHPTDGTPPLPGVGRASKGAEI